MERNWSIRNILKVSSLKNFVTNYGWTSNKILSYCFPLRYQVMVWYFLFQALGSGGNEIYI